MKDKKGIERLHLHILYLKCVFRPVHTFVVFSKSLIASYSCILFQFTGYNKTESMETKSVVMEEREQIPRLTRSLKAFTSLEGERCFQPAQSNRTIRHNKVSEVRCLIGLLVKGGKLFI